jgi:NAD(P)-dependent dehydrogenase (short-subunit alcohol dehydrogenase family)
MAEDKTIILLTGGNAGIGFSLAAALLSDKTKHVLLCSRSIDKGELAVKNLQSRELPGTVHLDVTSEESISAAAKTVEEKYGRYLCHVQLRRL